jgi:hypothetical protein
MKTGSKIVVGARYECGHDNIRVFIYVKEERF